MKFQITVLLLLIISLGLFFADTSVLGEEYSADRKAKAQKKILDSIATSNNSWNDPKLETLRENLKYVDLDQQVQHGKTYLEVAIAKDNYYICQAILEAGANPNYNPRRYSPLKMALDCQRRRIALLLVAQGAHINKLNKKQIDQIYAFAVDKSEWTVVLRLIDEKLIEIHQKGILDRTPLHYAADSGNATAVESLLKRNADPNINDEHLRTALDLAFYKKGSVDADLQAAPSRKGLYRYGEVIGLLIKHGTVMTPERAERYAHVRYAHTGIWRFFITTKISIWMWIFISLVVISGIYYLAKRSLQWPGIVCVLVLCLMAIVVVVIEVLCLMDPMKHVAVADSSIGWLPYMALRLLTFLTLCPLMCVKSETKPDDYSITKSCSSCGLQVSLFSQAGNKCPHCGCHWSH